MTTRKRRTPYGWQVERAKKAAEAAIKDSKASRLESDQLRQLLTSPCTYCGAEPPTPLPNKVDRIDPGLGFGAGNAVSVCGLCQRAKKSMPEEEFLAWIEKVHEKSVLPKKRP